jgi:cardiolipin synthase A/B
VSENVLMLLNILIVVYWVGVLILLISEDRDATATLAWILVLFALPFFGLVVYFFFGRNWPRIIQRAPVTRQLQEIIGRFMPGVYAPYADQSREFTDRLGTGFEGRIARVIEQKAGAPPLPVRTCDVYGTGEEYFDVLIADLASAERFIHMQYFIWKQDELTARITKVLLDRLAVGVEVRILNDFIGNVQYRKDEMKALKAAGALIGSDIAQLSRANYSNHRKITVVDGEIGHTGGFNIGQEYIDGGKRFPAWRDTGLRLTGPGVADLEKLFDMRWYEAQGEDLFDMRYYPDPTLPHGDIMVQTVHHGYDDRWKSATRAYQVAMSGARERIMLQSPYFVPDPSTLDILINAAAAGVRVDFMITGMLDKKVPYWAAETYFEPILAAGGRIWIWEKGFFHAKALTIDNAVCSIGTLNMDMRSLYINKELMVWSWDPRLVADSKRLFEEDLLECRELTLDEVLAWGYGRRFRNSAARLLSNLL